MRKFRWNYWSCSRFADWVRGERKPPALGLRDWEDWRKQTSAKKPIRFYLAETLLDNAQNIVMFPRDVADAVYYWWYNRFVAKTHFLKTGLEPGCFHELDERIMQGLFNELVEFVEVELALMGSYGEGKSYKFVRGRCPEAGVDHLLWSSSLTFGEDELIEKDDPQYGQPTRQAESSASILKLYRWWKFDRSARPDPHDASGWSLLYDEDPSKERDEAFESLSSIEERYEKEDEDMLVLLIKIRKHLWT